MFTWLKRWWQNVKLEITYSDRLEWVDQLAGGLDTIADSAEVRNLLPEAIRRIEYLRARMVAVMPRVNQSGQLIADYVTEPVDKHLPALLVFPMLRSDSGINPVAAYLREHAQAGSYSPHVHMIVLGMDELETIRFMASTLLHEVGHAMAAEKEGRILDSSTSRDEALRLEEELSMWHFDCRLAGFLGGEELRRQMEATAMKICQGWASGIPFEMGIEATSPLDMCYGSVPKGGSFGRRTVLYMRYCELLALHMFFGPVAAHERQLLLIGHIVSAGRKKEKDFMLNSKH